MAEGAIRDDLRGHGSAVAACAFSNKAHDWHAATLQQELQLDNTRWDERLQSIRALGFDLSYAMESLPGQGLRPQETLARLSILSWLLMIPFMFYLLQDTAWGQTVFSRQKPHRRSAKMYPGNCSINLDSAGNQRFPSYVAVIDISEYLRLRTCHILNILISRYIRKI